MTGEHDIDEMRGKPFYAAGGLVFINPGTGNVSGATLENAIRNMHQFIEDCPLDDLVFAKSTEDYDAAYPGDGRFGFDVYGGINPTPINIQMPGWSLEQVRYTGDEGQNIWDFPRLYVDHSSYVWKYALLDETYWEERMAYQLTDQNLMDKSTKDNEVARLRAALGKILALERLSLSDEWHFHNWLVENGVDLMFSLDNVENGSWMDGHNVLLERVQQIARTALETDE
jgi:hypothetical protein